ncbi:hypothetical protein [Corynebacterium sp. LK2510]|uniref:hypothetical protein n=1 Tax=Corynebacterium sp. LK2510 TaxID=3110472 RepID=UPI0034CFC653
MKTRNLIVAASAAALAMTAAPAANAQIVAPEPSSRIEIPASIVDFGQAFSPLSRFETEQVMKIGTAWFILGTATSLGFTLLNMGSSLAASAL